MALTHEPSREQLCESTHHMMDASEMAIMRPLDNQEGVFFNAPTNLVQGQVVVNSKRLNWTLEIPQDGLAYDGIAHFLSGFGGIKQTSRAPRQALAAQGIATLTSEPARGGVLPTLEDITDPQKLHTNAQLAIAADLRLRRNEISRKIPNGRHIDIDKKMLLPHSMGGAAAIGYAEHETATVDMIVNIATIGRGAPTLTDILRISPKDVLKSLYHEMLPAVLNERIELSMRNVMDVIHYYARVRTLFEANSCMRLDLRPRQKNLIDKGVDIRSLDFEHDILVPIPKHQADVMLKNAGHLAPQCKPNVVAAEIAHLERNRVTV